MSSELIDGIRDWHRKRNAAMEIRKRADLALGANLRTWLGWRKDLPEADRKRIAKHAADLIECGESNAILEKIHAENLARSDAGKKLKAVPAGHPLGDSEEFLAFGPFIAMAIQARAPTDAYEDMATKAMERLAQQLPVWGAFGEPILGFGARSLAVIVGEAGDLSNYATHSKLWKRMGLAVIDGRRQGMVDKGLGRDDRKAAFIAHGYSPIRRSRSWNIAEALCKGQVRKVKDAAGEDTGARTSLGIYGGIYLARKQYERNRAVFEGKTLAPSAKIPKGRAAEFMSDGHVEALARRYMEKKLLRDLWQAWRRAELGVPERAISPLPAAVHSAAPDGAGEAMTELPARASARVPPRKSRKAPAGAVAAIAPVPKGQLLVAATKPSKAAKAAGRAGAPLPVKATLAVLDHPSGDAL